MKKGKAAKMAMNIFQSFKECSEIDRELMRRVPDQDCINAILAKCKVVPPPNFTPIKNAAKKLAKQKAKDNQTK
ncbi:hypothetical protein DSO57_1028793 [Entomophthora muscae]|nr:hypothetical protein DSO57_1028793 [Entomophthora muscae]